MSFSNTTSNPFDNIAASAGPSPLGAWLIATVRSRLARREAAAAPRDRQREAAEVRALADRVRATDPGFAADLAAAADRHELLVD